MGYISHPTSMTYDSTFLKGLRKTTHNLIHDNHFHD